MNSTTLILIVGGLALYAFRRRGGSGASSGDGRTVELDHESGLRAVAAQYGKPLARKVEQIYRLETGNFSSGGYRNTGAAGQKAAGSTPDRYPFGWSSRGFGPERFNPVWYARDNNEGPGAIPWVSWRKASDAMLFLAKVLRERGDNPGAWNSTDPVKQVQYTNAVNALPTPIVDALPG